VVVTPASDIPVTNDALVLTIDFTLTVESCAALRNLWLAGRPIPHATARQSSRRGWLRGCDSKAVVAEEGVTSSRNHASHCRLCLLCDAAILAGTGQYSVGPPFAVASLKLSVDQYGTVECVGRSAGK